MEHLYIEQSPHTPEVYFNLDENKLCLIGRSFPEDASAFYAPIIDWLEHNIQEFPEGFTIEIHLDYYNTSSSKYLLKIFRFLEEYHSKTSVPVCIHWFYPENDDDVKNAGLEFQQFVAVPFKFEIEQ